LRSKYRREDESMQIGYGTSSGTSTGTFLYNSYGGYKHQYIFTVAELKQEGLAAGPITALKFDIVKPGTRTRDGFTIAIGSTTQNTASTNMIPNNTLQTVYSSGKYQMFTTGVMTFTFSTPYDWDGKSNIVVETNWSNEGTGGTSGEVKYHTTTSNRTS